MTRAFLVAGLGYGDEGKGSVVDYLCRKHEAHTVVRYNGGAQAAHNVMTSDGRHHTFAQFGSGSFIPSVRTHLSRHMLVNPIFMMTEMKQLESIGVKDLKERTTIDRFAYVTNPFHVAMNRIRELARDPKLKHGSCGMGIAETVADHLELKQAEDALIIADLTDRITMRRKLHLCQESRIDAAARILQGIPITGELKREYDILHSPTAIDDCIDRYTQFAHVFRFVGPEYLDRIVKEHTTVFEGAQGVLLDESHGFYPYNTWTNCTFSNALDLLKTDQVSTFKIGVMRSYMTRHGPGPFVTEDPELAITEAHNGTGQWQGHFRTGHLDIPALRYAMRVLAESSPLGNVSVLAVTHMDQLPSRPKVCIDYLHPDYYRGQGSEHLLPRVGYRYGDVAMLRITERLLKTKPLYVRFESKDDFLSGLPSLLKRPVHLLSYGPLAEDKIEVEP